MANCESDKKPHPEPKCFCGIEKSKARRICTERDCPFK